MMEPHGYLASMRRNWVIVVLGTLLGALAGGLISVSTTPTYTANASVYFAISYGNSANDLNQGAAYAQNQMLSFAILATAPVVLNEVIDELDLDTTPVKLARTLAVTTPQNTVVLDISASSTSAATASGVANSVASNLGDKVEQFAPKDSSGSSTVVARTIADAEVPLVQSAPNTRVNIAIATVLGLVLGAVMAILREVADTRVKRDSDVERLTSTPVIGSIERDQAAASGGLVMRRDPLGTVAETFRTLRANLRFVAVDRDGLALAVTSSLPAEGKSMIASNLGLAVAEGGRMAVLVDADLRRPAVARYLELEGAAGLTTILAGRATLADVVQLGGHPSFHVLTSGELPPNPSELLSSRAMHSLIADLRSRYDVVIIDTAPLLAVADAQIVSLLVDGVVVVADTTKLRMPQLTRTLADLRRSGATILGVVLNRVKRQSDRVAYYGLDSKFQRSMRRQNSKYSRRGDAATAAPPQVTDTPRAGQTAQTSPTAPIERILAVAPPVRPGMLDTRGPDATVPTAVTNSLDSSEASQLPTKTRPSQPRKPRTPRQPAAPKPNTVAKQTVSDAPPGIAEVSRDMTTADGAHPHQPDGAPA